MQRTRLFAAIVCGLLLAITGKTHDNQAGGSFRGILVGLLFLHLLFVSTLSAEELVLGAGATHVVQPGDAECVKTATVRNDSPRVRKTQDCVGNRVTLFLDTGTTLVPNTVDITASTRFVKQFRVETVEGASESSFLPVQIAVPVAWRGTLVNDNSVPTPGPLDAVGAHATVNMFLRLGEGDPFNPAARVTTVKLNRFQGVSHAGISGCLSVPTTPVAAATMMAKCLVAIVRRDEGSGIVFLSAVVETGKTYNVELELLGDIFSFNTGPFGGGFPGGVPNPGGHPFANFEENLITAAPFGLIWEGPMLITIGTDFQSRIQGIHDDIDELRAMLMELREDFDGHTHDYLTGRGRGHNNAAATTTLPIF